METILIIFTVFFGIFTICNVFILVVNSRVLRNNSKGIAINKEVLEATKLQKKAMRKALVKMDVEIELLKMQIIVIAKGNGNE